MADKCGTYKDSDEIFYLNPGSSLDKGLVNLGQGKDEDVMGMLEFAARHGTIAMYVSHFGDLKCTPSKVNDTPMQSSSTNLDKGKPILEYELDVRPPSPVASEEAGGCESDDDTALSEEEGRKRELLEADLNDDFTIGDDGENTSDEEFYENMDKAKGLSMQLMIISQNLQNKAVLGRLGEQSEGGTSGDVPNITEEEHDGNLSYGVLIGEDGSLCMNEPGKGGPRILTGSSSSEVNVTQASTNQQP